MRCAHCGQPLPDTAKALAVAHAVASERRLTNKEREVLCYLAQRPGVVRTKAEILDYVYQLEPGDQPDVKIVDVFVCKLRKKLVGAELVVETMWGRGYFVKKSGSGGNGEANQHDADAVRGLVDEGAGAP